MAEWIWPVLALVAAALAIRCDLLGRRKPVFVFRPLAMLFIIATACRGSDPISPEYRVLIVAGLVLSLAGDTFMMLLRKRFAAGLAAFMAAHLVYLLAFRPAPGRPVSTGTVLPFLILALLVFRFLAPHLGKWKFPVFIYILAITAMTAFAAGRFIEGGGTGPLLALAGAALFMVSGGILAYNRFVKKIDQAQLFILGLYYPAQLLIALSV